MYPIVALVIVGVVGWVVFILARSKRLQQVVGSYALSADPVAQTLAVRADLAHAERVRLVAHVMAVRLFYHRGTATFGALIERAGNVLHGARPVAVVADTGAAVSTQGTLTYAGLGISGVIGMGADARRTRDQIYATEVEGALAWVLDDPATQEEARRVLPAILQQESSPRLLDLGQVNARVRKHFAPPR